MSSPSLYFLSFNLLNQFMSAGYDKLQQIKAKNHIMKALRGLFYGSCIALPCSS